jgi:hypothetical protein
MPLLTSLTKNFRPWPAILTLAVPALNWKKAYGAFRLAGMSFFYRVIPAGVEIIRVLHGSRDLNAIFNPDD